MKCKYLDEYFRCVSCFLVFVHILLNLSCLPLLTHRKCLLLLESLFRPAGQCQFNFPVCFHSAKHQESMLFVRYQMTFPRNLEVLKHLWHRGWAGGAQLCLSNAFGETKRLEAQAQDLSRDFWYLGWMDGVWWDGVLKKLGGCGCFGDVHAEKGGGWKKAGTRTCLTFFEGKYQANVGGQHPSSSTGRTYWTMDVARMIQRCNAFVLSQLGVKQRGTVFVFETLWLSFGEVIALSCADVYWSIERGNIYEYMIVSVSSPNGGARNHICF